MSKRKDRRAKQRLIDQRHRRSALHQNLAHVTDPTERARLLAQAEREMRGYILITDDEPHYLCELGLKDVTRG